jgi:hypothetical protein
MTEKDKVEQFIGKMFIASFLGAYFICCQCPSEGGYTNDVSTNRMPKCQIQFA